MRPLTAIAFLCVVSGHLAAAETATLIRGRGHPLSYLYNIQSVHEASSDGEVARVYGLPAKNNVDITLALEIIGDNRPPNYNKASRIAIWSLSYVLARVDRITVSDTSVVIYGWNYDEGRVMCTSVFHYKDGTLADNLDEQGCVRYEEK